VATGCIFYIIYDMNMMLDTCYYTEFHKCSWRRP